MPTRSENWRDNVGAALDKATPIGARLVQSLESLTLGNPATAQVAVGGGAGPGYDLSDQLHGWTRNIDQSIRRPAWVGLIMLVVFVGGLGLWATTAPLTSAVVAHGSFVATGQNKIVQHLEGGIIAKILVNEGDQVQAGQALIELDDTSIRSEVQRYEIKRATQLAAKARLDAEREGAREITFPDELSQLGANPEVAKSVQAQRSLFMTRRDEFDAQRQINERQIGAIEQEIEGLKAQKDSSEQQLDLMATEVESAEKLLEKGLIERSRVMDMQRNKAKLEGDVGQYMSEIGKAEQHVLETRTNLTQLRSKMFSEDADLYLSLIHISEPTRPY